MPRRYYVQCDSSSRNVVGQTPAPTILQSSIGTRREHVLTQDIMHLGPVCRTVMSLLVLLAIGCSPSDKTKEAITLATTTSTIDSGLMDVLARTFQQQTGISLHCVVRGSGQALEMGRWGDIDVLLTHAPDAERHFIAEGHAEQRRAVMYNRFVLVGPASDSADISERGSIIGAFKQIARVGALFVSRGDESGTHMKEQAIWLACQVKPEGPWLLQAGAGMAQTLRIANEKRAYTLSDHGTFLAQRGELDLAVIYQGNPLREPLLANIYSVMVVNVAKHPHVRHDGAKRFSAFLLTPQVQEMIGRFGVDRFGEPLFFASIQ